MNYVLYIKGISWYYARTDARGSKRFCMVKQNAKKFHRRVDAGLEARILGLKDYQILEA